jgi:hypothetical protein
MSQESNSNENNTAAAIHNNAAANTTTNTSSTATVAESSLVPAELRDFYEGSEIYIRGHKAVCIRLDYPHVYWRYLDSPPDFEKHRSFTATAGIFSVDPIYRQQAINRGENRGQYNDTEEPDYLPPPPTEEVEDNDNNSSSNDNDNTVS